MCLDAVKSSTPQHFLEPIATNTRTLGSHGSQEDTSLRRLAHAELEAALCARGRLVRPTETPPRNLPLFPRLQSQCVVVASNEYCEAPCLFQSSLAVNSVCILITMPQVACRPSVSRPASCTAHLQPTRRRVCSFQNPGSGATVRVLTTPHYCHVPISNITIEGILPIVCADRTCRAEVPSLQRRRRVHCSMLRCLVSA
jgi:hypothetical protein